MSQLNAVVSSTLFAASAAVFIAWKFVNQKPKHAARVKKIVIYPVKSCGGIELQSAIVTKRGFLYDRAFMIVDEKGNFVSQRKKPTMALIKTQLDHQRGLLILNAPGMSQLEVPLAESANEEARTVTVWGESCEGRVIDTQGWFSKFLELPSLELVRMGSSWVRPTDPKYAPKGQTGFADGFAFLLASEGSVEEVSRRANFPVSMDRFRPNIVVDECEAFAEDSWTNIVFASQPAMKAKVVKPCSRCSMPDVDQETAVYDKDMRVSKALKTFRTGEALNLEEEKWKKQVSQSTLLPRLATHLDLNCSYLCLLQLFFGQNIDHESQENVVISVGDKITLA